MPPRRIPPLRALALLFLPLAAFLLGSCGNDPNPKPLEKKRPDGSPWVVRYYYMPDEVRSLDPQMMYDQVSHRIMEAVQDCLLEYNPMKTDPYEVQSCLLESVPNHTADANGGVTYHCKLKPGILYHDDPCFPGGKGREVLASDVHFAFQRLCDPQMDMVTHTASPVFGNLAEYVAGMTEANEAAKKNGGTFDYDTMKVRGIEVLDKYSFDLHLLKPYPQIVYWMAMHFTCPVAPEAVKYYDGQAHPDGPQGETVVRPLFSFHPVGNGPFKIAEWIRGQRFRLVRNATYRTTVFPEGGWPQEWEAANRPLAGKPLPLVDEVQMTIFRELLPIWLLTRQGYLDRMGVQKDAVNSVVNSSSQLTEKYAKRGMSLTRAVEVSTFYMCFNMQDPVVGSNKKLRQAISASYNAQGYSDMLYGGVAPVAQQLLSPGIFGYQKDFRNPYGFDLEKAKRLMAEAGYPNGIDPKTGEPLEITMDVVATGGEERQLAEYEQRQLEQTGIRVKVIENTFARQQEKEDQGNFQLVSGSGWGADYPDPENYFFLFIKNNFPPEGKNACRYTNPEFEKLFDQMSTMDNSPERYEIVKKMNDILLEDCPIILNFHKAYNVVVQPWAPITHMNMLLEPGIKYMPIDYALREQKRREWNPVSRWPLVLVIGILGAGLGGGIYINRKRNV